MKKTFTLILCFLLTVSLFGCSAEGDYVPTGNALYQEGQQETEPEDATGKYLVLSYYPEVSLNPYTCNNYTNRVLFTLIYQGLFATDRNYQSTPILCKEYTMSTDMRTYTFYLETATFSDGTKVTPEDVLASYEAAKKGKYYSGRFSHVRKVELTEDGGITFSLDTAMDSLPLLLDFPIVKADQVGEAQPIGTGPYVYEHFSTGMRLRRRGDWWCTSPDLMIKATSIPLREVDSVIGVRDAFEFSDVSLALSDPCSDAYAEYRSDYELWDCENGVMLYLGCNMDSRVFSNETMRAAMTYVVDRQAIADTYYRGFSQPASLAASPSSPYYNTTLAQRYTFDKQKLAEAVVTVGITGREIQFLVNKDDTLRLKVAREIAKTITECGLTVTMVEVSNNLYHEKLKYGVYDIYLGQTRLSPNMDLSPFFRGMGGLHYGNIADSTLYALCQQSLANIGNYYNLHQKLAEDGRIVPILFHRYNVHATRGLLTGLAPARDNVFFYSLGKSMNEVLKESVSD